MKKLDKYFKPTMIRPVIYRTLSRFIVGLVLVLLWDRFINTNGLLTLTGHGFFFMGAVYLAWGWFTYLRLDGVKIIRFNKADPESGRKRRAVKNMSDHVDTEITFDGMDDRDRQIVGFFSNLLAGLIFIVPSIIVSILK